MHIDLPASHNTSIVNIDIANLTTGQLRVVSFDLIENRRQVQTLVNTIIICVNTLNVNLRNGLSNLAPTVNVLKYSFTAFSIYKVACLMTETLARIGDRIS